MTDQVSYPHNTSCKITVLYIYILKIANGNTFRLLTECHKFTENVKFSKSNLMFVWPCIRDNIKEKTNLMQQNAGLFTQHVSSIIMPIFRSALLSTTFWCPNLEIWIVRFGSLV
jgi:hypothetical protein